MWKDYFYLTKRERASVWVMTVLVLILQVGIWTSNFWLPPMVRLMKPQARTPVPAEALSGGGDSNSLAGAESIEPKPVLHVFNPNTADSSVLRGVGLNPKVVRNILKYRSKGGQFRKPDDMAKIYGLDPGVFRRLRPYIRLSETQESREAFSGNRGDSGINQFGSATDQPGKGSDQRGTGRSVYESGYREPTLAATPVSASSEKPALLVDAPSSGSSTSSARSTSLSAHPVSSTEPSLNVPVRPASPSVAGIRFELNEADTATLQLLKGVGAVTASRIVRYRQQLGGFYDVRQLNEIKGLYPAVLETLTKTVSVNPEKITKININKASLEKLKAHPYLDFYQAKVIVELRKNRKAIRALSELAAFTEFTPADLERLKWYLEL